MGKALPSVVTQGVTLHEESLPVDLLFWLMGAALVGWGFNTTDPIPALVGECLSPFLPISSRTNACKALVINLIPGNFLVPRAKLISWT